MRIREATPDDYDEIARITLDAYRALPRWVGDGYALTLADVAARAAPGSGATVLLAEGEDGKPAGSVTLVLDRGPYFEADPTTGGDCGFRMLAVAPAAWGSGTGPALVRECLARARVAGRRRMLIFSTEWMTTAHRIYQGMGFRRRPEFDQQWDDVRGLCFVLDLAGEGQPVA